MKRYYPLLSRQLFNRKYRKLVQKNLTKVFNKFTAVRKYINCIKTEFKSSYRDKIKAEYHQHGNIYAILSPPSPSPPKQIPLSSQPITNESAAAVIDLSPKRTIIVPRSFLTPPDDLKKKNFDIIQMSAGKYLNFFLTSSIDELTDHFSPCETIELTVAIYVQKSLVNELQLPRYLFILGRLTQKSAYTEPKTFTIGVYQGLFPKETIGNEILEPFVRQMEAIAPDGRLSLKAIVADPIAASLITCSSMPNSLFGCTKCRQSGRVQFNHNHTSYPQSCKPEYRRRDKDFQNCESSVFHSTEPILARLPIGLFSQMIVDYKHIVCMGVVRQLMELWRSGRIDYRLNVEQQQQISSELLEIAATTHCELPVRPKSLVELSQWTPNDWQQFLLYHGPVVLENKLAPKYYIHFLCLHLATRIMCNRNAQREYSAFIVGFLMKRFVREFAELYGAELITHDVHMLLHYEEVMLSYGSVADVCGFNYTEELARIEKCIETKEDLKDFGYELCATRAEYHKQRRAHHVLPSRSEADFQIISSKDDSVMPMKHFQLKIGPQNGYVITKKGIVRLCRVERLVNGTIILIGQRYQHTYILYQAPFTDEKLWLVEEPAEPEVFLLSDVVAKGMRYDTARGICIMPIVCF